MLMICALLHKIQKELINIFKSKYQPKVKGDGPFTYHLGADYNHDLDETMVCQPKKNIEKLKETYIRLFNSEPSNSPETPLEKNDHPELDTADILEGQQVNHYFTMVGQLQWLITLVRFDIQAQVISMSRFRTTKTRTPREITKHLCICHKSQRLFNQV